MITILVKSYYRGIYFYWIVITIYVICAVHLKHAPLEKSHLIADLYLQKVIFKVFPYHQINYCAARLSLFINSYNFRISNTQ